MKSVFLARLRKPNPSARRLSSQSKLESCLFCSRRGGLAVTRPGLVVDLFAWDRSCFHTDVPAVPRGSPHWEYWNVGEGGVYFKERSSGGGGVLRGAL